MDESHEYKMEESKQEIPPVDFVIIVPYHSLKNLEPNLLKVCILVTQID